MKKDHGLIWYMNGEDEIKELLNCKLIYEPTIFKNRYYEFLPLVYHFMLMLKNGGKPVLFLK